MPDIKPRYEVHAVPEDERTPRTVTAHQGKEGSGGIFESTEVPDDRPQYDVYFPHGHSIRIIGDEELAAQGFVDPSVLVDMESGDVVGRMADNSLKTHSQRKTKNKKRVLGEAATGPS